MHPLSKEVPAYSHISVDVAVQLMKLFFTDPAICTVRVAVLPDGTSDQEVVWSLW